VDVCARLLGLRLLLPVGRGPFEGAAETGGGLPALAWGG
jgi:hypothetical protein